MRNQKTYLIACQSPFINQIEVMAALSLLDDFLSRLELLEIHGENHFSQVLLAQSFEHKDLLQLVLYPSILETFRRITL